ncbi:MAG: septum formation initiator family protein [Erysipelotrichaceae bacterium]|nr:septum formation initiator family protein [Erysipelotrichaceae bacterium]
MAKAQTKKKTRRRPKLFVRVIFCAVLIGLTGFFLTQSTKEVVTTFSLKADISEAQDEIAALKKESDMLTNEKEKLSDENYVKNYARGEYTITKKGEQIIHLPNTNGGTNEDSDEK